MTDPGWKRELEAKVYAGERLTRDDGEALYAVRRPGLARDGWPTTGAPSSTATG